MKLAHLGPLETRAAPLAGWRLFACWLAMALLSSDALSKTPTGDQKMLDDFEEDRGWQTVNDNVMGGRSLGQVSLQNGHLVFEGALNTNGGGFASVRRPIAPGSLSDARGLLLHAKGDGRGYRLTLRGDQQFRGRTVTYQVDFPDMETDRWVDVRIGFDRLSPSLFGQRVPVGPLDLGSVWSIGVIIADGVDGPFKLQIDSLQLEGE